MPEEPREPGQDLGSVGAPNEESGLVVNTLVREFPTVPRTQVISVIETSKVEIAPSVTTEDLMIRARERLKAMAGGSSTVPPPHPKSAQPLEQGRKTGPSNQSGPSSSRRDR